MHDFRVSRIFMMVTLVILVSDVAFLVANYAAARRSLELSMHQEAEKLRSGFEVAISMTHTNMLQLARFVGSDPRVQQTVLAGRNAVEAEGGGPGGPRAAVARKALMDLVHARWNQMQQEFGVRQLHFHLAPGSLSFLRVHAPDKFGDRMDGLRRIITDVNTDLKPRVGLETGRIYTGLRGVAPLMAVDPATGTEVHLGAVEVGSSFEPVVAALDKSLGAGIAVLLKKEHVDGAMWQDFVRRYLPNEVTDCGCFVETTSRPDIYTFLKDDGFRAARNQTITFPIKLDGKVFSVTRFPLTDYMASGDPAREPVGSVVLWTDDTEAFAAFERSQMFNLVYGVFGFLLVEAGLWAALRMGAGKLRQELANRTAELSNANAELEKFASIISHDLQAPLRMVVSYLTLIERKLGPGADADTKEFLQFAVDGGRRMSAMIRDLLAYSRVGRTQTDLVPVDLGLVARTVLHDLDGAITETGAGVELADPLPTVKGMAGELTRLLANLVTNAVKYRSPERPLKLRIACVRDGAKVRVEVSDNGIGIPEESRERVFEFFHRVGQQPDVDGTGIGLAVARKVVEMHGGRIWVEPNPAGPGSVFKFTLPAA
ncbi:MAG TPA: ATP-binding protein [Candidatus Omnitrophota bacterium]|nr:ATP-binding protein [Candidatus Omnitrophota bacterium]